MKVILCKQQYVAMSMIIVKKKSYYIYFGLLFKSLSLCFRKNGA